MMEVTLTVRPRIWVRAFMWLLKRAPITCFWVKWAGPDSVMAFVKRHGFVVSA